MKKEIIIPQFTCDEFVKLVLVNLQEQYSRGDIELNDLLFAPELDMENPTPWIEWSYFLDLRPHTCIVWVDLYGLKNTFYMISGDNCVVVTNE